MENIEVYKAINRVQAALAEIGIAKDKRNTQQNYQFRGIDDVYNALAPLLAKNELCILPRCIGRDVQERQSKTGSALFYVAVEVEFDFVSAKDGSKHTVATFGEAMDSGDKATNKAMSTAYKYAAFQTFAIPTEATAQDADADTPPPVQPKTPTRQTPLPPAPVNPPGGGGLASSKPATQPSNKQKWPGDTLYDFDPMKVTRDELVARWGVMQERLKAERGFDPLLRHPVMGKNGKPVTIGFMPTKQDKVMDIRQAVATCMKQERLGKYNDGYVEKDEPDEPAGVKVSSGGNEPPPHSDDDLPF